MLQIKKPSTLFSIEGFRPQHPKSSDIAGKKLRSPELKRTILTVNYSFPIHFIYNGPRLELRTGTPPIHLTQDERITKKLIKDNTPILRKQSPLVEALKYAEVLNEPSIVSNAQVGARFGVSRARVCQMLNLLNLDESIKQYLLSIKDSKEHNFFTERKLRDIAIIKERNLQIREFKGLIKKMENEYI